MVTSGMTYLVLDNYYDPVFDPGAALSGADAVAQAMLTRLRLFQGEWWENLSTGLPMFQTILGQLASAKGLQAMQLAVQLVILGTPNVTVITSINAQFNNATCNLQISAVVETAFGQAIIDTQSPASMSNLEGGL